MKQRPSQSTDGTEVICVSFCVFKVELLNWRRKQVNVIKTNREWDKWVRLSLEITAGAVFIAKSRIKLRHKFFWRRFCFYQSQSARQTSLHKYSRTHKKQQISWRNRYLRTQIRSAVVWYNCVIIFMLLGAIHLFVVTFS